MSQILASPNRLVRAYASSARGLAAQAVAAGSAETAREHTVAANAMAVATVETYLNVLARLWISQNPGFEHRDRVGADLRNKKPLGRKLEEWPAIFFGKKADYGVGAGQRFRMCLDRRNQLMHFHSDSHRFEFENVVISGLIDSTAYDALTPEDAAGFVRASEEFIAYLMQLQGVSADQIPHALHYWLGMPP